MAEFKNIEVEKLRSLLAQKNIRLVDVRTDAEIAQGFIQGADKLPLHLLPVRLQELDAQRRQCFTVAWAGVRRRLRRLPPHKVSPMFTTCKGVLKRGRRPVSRLWSERFTQVNYTERQKS